jgi:hypothetical protein
MFTYLKKLLSKKKNRTEKIKVKNFFDYPAREKKKVIKKATAGAVEKQKKLIRGYDFVYYKSL